MNTVRFTESFILIIYFECLIVFNYSMSEIDDEISLKIFH